MRPLDCQMARVHQHLAVAVLLSGQGTCTTDCISRQTDIWKWQNLWLGDCGPGYEIGHGSGPKSVRRRSRVAGNWLCSEELHHEGPKPIRAWQGGTIGGGAKLEARATAACLNLGCCMLLLSQKRMDENALHFGWLIWLHLSHASVTAGRGAPTKTAGTWFTCFGTHGHRPGSGIHETGAARNGPAPCPHPNS